MTKDDEYYKKKAARIVLAVEAQGSRAAKRRVVKALGVSWPEYKQIKKIVPKEVYNGAKRR